LFQFTVYQFRTALIIGGLKQLNSLLMRPIGLARCAPRLRQLMKGAIFFMAQPPLCAEHVQQLGSENLLSNLMEVKD